MKPPFLLFSIRKLEENIVRIQNLSKALFKDRNVNIFYAVKVNYSVPVLKTLFKNGIGAEISRPKELKMALEHHSQNMILNGHYKSDELIYDSIQNGVKRIYVESLSELIRVNAVAKKVNKKVDVGVRIKVSENNKVGADLDEVNAISKFQSEFLNISAVHYHLGWNVRNMDFVLSSLEKLIQAAQLLKQNGRNIDTANIGGSFVEFYEDQKQIYERFVEYQKRIPDFIKNIEIEPGRYFVGDCGVLYANVVEIRNLGSTINTCAYGYKLTGGTPSVALVSVGSRKDLRVPLVLFGHWAAENDAITLANETRVPRIGDFVRFRNYGAYLDTWFDQLSLDADVNFEFIHPYDELQKYLEAIQTGSSSILRNHWDHLKDELKSLPVKKGDLRLLLRSITEWIEKQPFSSDEDLALRLIYHDYSTLRREIKTYQQS